MNKLVDPLIFPSIAADSRVRTLVVPTATTRRADSISLHASAEIEYRSK
jgi:hypothetical protein